MEALLGLIALIVVALVGWAIAEFKYKASPSPALQRTLKRRRSWKSSAVPTDSRR